VELGRESSSGLYRKGKTDWTMDLPKINYGEDDSDEEDKRSSRSEEDDEEEGEDEDRLINVEDIALSDDEEVKPKMDKKFKMESDDEDDDDEADESIAKLEQKYLKMK
jgi:hypothetical protein